MSSAPESDLQQKRTAAVAAALSLIKEFEGCELEAYPDPETGNEPWTIGWGTTDYKNGEAVREGDVIDQDTADTLLRDRVDSDYVTLEGHIPSWNDLNANQQAALLSFSYNCGVDWYGSDGFATLTSRVEHSDLGEVPGALMLYVNPGGPTEDGLRRRRKAEGDLWSKPVATVATVVVTPVTPEGDVIIEALKPTWLKKKPLQADELEEHEKVEVAQGKVYEVKTFTEVAATAHAQVELDHAAGTWFIFEPHWEVTRDHPTGERPRGDEPHSLDWSDFTAMVTPNLSVGEVLQWDRRRIPPEGAVRGRLLKTAEQFQRVRDAWGKPLAVTSFYRPEPINTEVGGVPGSRHITGEAMDIYPTTASLESFYEWIRRRWTGGLGDGRNRGFIHLDTRQGGCFVPGAGVMPCVEWLY